ncbi:MAG: hypothetical protein P9M06_07615 [Candidatus Saelkia tenebricola]|nr:hypothetical protein [Candidatus Saelkia tenebricola]
MMKINSNWIAVVLFLLIVIGIFYFLFPDISTHVLGDKFNDVWVSCWHIWWDQTAFNQILKADFYTDKIFYPAGVNVHRHIPILFTDFLAIPFTFLFNITTSYNFLVMMLIFLNCVAMFFLAKYLTHNGYASFISGIIYGINAYVFGQIYNGALETINLVFLPLYILMFLKLINTNRRRYIFMSGLLLLFTTLSCWYYGLYLLFFTLLYIFIIIVMRAKFVCYKKTLLSCFWVLVLYAIFIAPMAYVLITRFIFFKTSIDIYKSQLDFIVDIKDFFTPGKLVFDSTVRHFMKSTYIGFSCLSLSLLAVVSRHRKEVVKWCFLGIFFLILTLGCRLSLFEHVFYNFYLPSKFLPVINTYRAFAVCLLIIAVISGYGMLFLVEIINRDRRNKLLVSITAITIIAEVLLVSPGPYPLPVTDMQIPAIYQELAKDKNDYAIIDIPFDLYNHLLCGKYMYYQTLHEKSIPYAVSYLSPSAKNIKHWDYIEENPFLNLILFNLGNVIYMSKSEIEILVQSCSELKKDGFLYLLLHNEFLNEGTKKALERLLLESCILIDNSDERISMYKLK